MEQPSYLLSSLTPLQIKALPLLAAGDKAIEVSKKLKISKQSLSEWRQDIKFMQALEFMREEALTEAVIAINTLATDAVQILKRLMTTSSNENIQLRAAIFIIEHLRLKELHDGAVSGNHGVSSTVDMNKLFDAIGISGN